MCRNFLSVILMTCMVSSSLCGCTIVHEMGHAVYSEFSAEDQNTYNNNPGIFTQEVASTANDDKCYTRRQSAYRKRGSAG